MRKLGGVYSGRVVDAGGAPVVGARIHLYVLGSSGPQRVEAISDASGAFEVRGLPRAPALAYAASDDGVSDEAQVNLVDRPEVRDQMLVLTSIDRSVLAGVVIDADGAPRTAMAVEVMALERWIEASTITDERGAFLFTGLPAGAYRFWTNETDEIAVHAGDTTVCVRVPRTGGIRGAVVYADGGGVVEDVTLHLEPSANGAEIVRGEHGTFEVHGLRPGLHALRVTGPDILIAHQEVRVNEDATTDIGTIHARRGCQGAGYLIG